MGANLESEQVHATIGEGGAAELEEQCRDFWSSIPSPHLGTRSAQLYGGLLIGPFSGAPIMGSS